MKSQIKIIFIEGKFIGQLLQGETVTYQTPPCRDSITASRALSQHIGVHHSNTPSKQTDVVTMKKATPSGKCCGRG